MSLVFGFVTSDDAGEHVHLVADSIVLEDTYTRFRSDDTKLFFAGEQREYLIGVCGGLRALQAVKYGVRYPVWREPEPGEPEPNVHAFVVDSVVRAIRKGLRRFGVNWNESFDAELLVAFRGRLFSIDSDFGVFESSDGYMAIGAGADLALGALAALDISRDDLGERVCDTARIAMRAASRHSAAACAPWLYANNRSKTIDFL